MSLSSGSTQSRLTKHAGPRHAATNPQRSAPPFVDEILGTLSVHSQFVLHGNIRDRYLAQHRRGGELVETDRSLPESLWDGLRRLGYGALLSYDQITGFITLIGPDQDTVVELLNDALRSPRSGQTGGRTPQLLEAEPLLREIVTGFQERRTGQRRDGRQAEPLRLALLIDYSSRLSTDVTRLSDAEKDFFLACVQLAQQAEPLAPGAHLPPRDPAGGGELFNPVIWLADSDRDLPHWLVSGSERIRAVAVPGPRRRRARTHGRAAGLGAPARQGRRRIRTPGRHRNRTGRAVRTVAAGPGHRVRQGGGRSVPGRDAAEPPARPVPGHAVRGDAGRGTHLPARRGEGPLAFLGDPRADRRRS
ncbi:hypothetical protein ACRJ4W_29875 [Streptomyces sp. GLT-R25]